MPAYPQLHNGSARYLGDADLDVPVRDRVGLSNRILRRISVANDGESAAVIRLSRRSN